MLIFWQNFEVTFLLLRVGGMDEIIFESGDDGEVEEKAEEGFVLTGVCVLCLFLFLPRGLLFLQDHVYCMLRK